MSRPLEDILFGAPSPRAQMVARVASVVAAGVLLLMAVGIGWRFHAEGQLDARFWTFFTLPTTWAFLAEGFLGTLASAASAGVIALTVGLVLVTGRLAKTPLLRWPSVALIEFLRGTPTLLLIYVCFMVLPQAGIQLSTYWMLTLPVGLSAAAVVAEVYRAGVLAVPRGQAHAARSLGMTEAQVFLSVVFPQALRYITPALVAQLVIVVKDTTFGYVVTYGELMQNAKVLIANYHALVPVYLVVAVLYCLVNYAISVAGQRLGRRRD